jgi:alpha-tubulin suppressor-like RCC1 family protein
MTRMTTRPRASFVLSLAAIAIGLIVGSAAAQDECGTAIPIVLGVPQAFDTSVATPSPNPPSDDLCPGTYLNWANSNDVWFSWVAPLNGNVAITTCDTTSYDTSIALYSGACESLVMLACNGDAPDSSGCQQYHAEIPLYAVIAGTTYYVRIGGYQGLTGAGTLTVSLTNATVCDVATMSCVEAHAEPGCADATCCAQVCAINPLCCDFGTGWDASCVEQALNTCYPYSCGEPNPAIANDCASNALPLGSGGLVPFDTTGANTDGPNPTASICGSNRSFWADVWFRFDPALEGVARFETCGLVAFDSKLAVYDIGENPNSFDYDLLPISQIGCNDDSPDCLLPNGASFASRLEVSVQAGRTYLLRIGGYEPGDQGPGQVLVSLLTGCDLDSDGDGTTNCNDGCPNDPAKTAPGVCGCGVADTDSDGDGTPNCNDGCPNDPAKTAPGVCGCGVADTDTDADGILDCNDNCDTVANPGQADCNANGVGDACEIAQGLLGDCDGDGVPNICEGAELVRLDSGLLAPFGSGSPAFFEFSSLNPVFLVTPRLVIEATSDLNSSSEFIAVTLDGGTPTYIFVADGSDCPASPDTWSRTFTAAEFATLAADGLLRVDLVASGTVSASQCAGGGVRVRLEYEALPASQDCNGNGQLDSCELGAGVQFDCNMNGRLDSCDLASGFADDCDADGVLDACELIAGTGADCDHDGLLDHCAIALGAPDCDADGLPDACEGTLQPIGAGSVGFAARAPTGRFVRVAAGVAYVLTLDEHGRLASWGYDYDGASRRTPTEGAFVDIAAGYVHSAAIDTQGRVSCWGLNTSGQCNVPTDLGPAIDVAVSKSDANTNPPSHTLAVLADGSVRAWGNNAYGQCAVPIGMPPATAVAAGQQHSLARLSDGRVAAWGASNWGQCDVPSALTNVTSIAAGVVHSLAVRADGTVVCWGRNSSGQCNVPAGLGQVVKVAAGAAHSIALRSDGTVAAWGLNAYGMLTAPAGIGTVVDIDADNFTNVAVDSLGRDYRWGLDYLGGPVVAPRPSARVVELAIGANNSINNLAQPHYVARLADGTVACWGNNARNQCDVPTGLTDVVAVAAAGSVTLSGADPISMALTRSGTVVRWGSSQSTALNVPADLKPVIAIALPSARSSAGTHAMALQIDGRVRCWGSNGYGQCNVPLNILYARGVAAGQFFSLALQFDGTVRGWGLNSSGQAAPPPTLVDARKISAGLAHAAALRENGTITVWGGSALQPPATLGPARDVSAGNAFTAALLENGEVATWGPGAAFPTTTAIASTGPYLGVRAGAYQMALLRANSADCDSDGVLDSCEFDLGTAVDCDGDGRIDACAIRDGSVSDCNANGTPDSCELVAGTASDCNANGRIDSCEAGSATDCDGNGVPDSCEFAAGVAVDCDANGRIDSCDLARFPSRDCDANGLLDDCEIALGTTADCNANGRPDSCDLATEAIVVRGSATSPLVTDAPIIREPILKTDAFSNHGVVLLADGTIRCWGRNLEGQCYTPVNLPPVTDVAAGSSHTLAVLANGSVRAWGSNAAGQCDVPPDLGPVSAVSASGHSLVIHTDGMVRGWGSNTYGQCNAPSDLGPCIGVDAGGGHSLAIRQDGSVRAWGWNIYLQSSVPPWLGTVTDVEAGSYHSMALRTDGTVACWGAATTLTAINNGQAIAPVDLGRCIAIAAGGNVSMALREDGTVVSWGGTPTAGLQTPQSLGRVQGISAGTNAAVAWRTPTADCDGNGVIEACEELTAAEDCNGNGLHDLCEGLGDCDGDGVADACEILAGAPDCNGNGLLDTCDIAAGDSSDLNANLIPDECGEFVVGGSGFATIQAAINAAPDGATIVIGPGTFTEALEISGRSLTIRGQPLGATTITNPGSTRVLTVTGVATDTVIVEHVSFYQSEDPTIGGIALVTGADLEFRSCELLLSRASLGGAVAAIDASLRIVDSVLSGNYASAGGAVWLDSSTAVIETSSLNGNNADGGIGGGAIATTATGTLSIDRTAFSVNFTNGSSSCILAGCPLEVLSSTFQYNGVASDGNIIAYGGGGVLSDTGFCINDVQAIGGSYQDLGGNWFSGDCDGDGYCDHDEAALLSGPSVFDPATATRYVLVDSEVEFQAAVDLASGLEGHLATLTTAGEHALVSNAFTTTDAWIGASQLDATSPQNAWAWVTGEPWSFTAWAPGNPDGDGQTEGLYSKGVMLVDGAWDDRNRFTRSRLILEISVFAYRRGRDCNGNEILDGCEIASGTAGDCDDDGILDSCEIASGDAGDCDGDGVPDSCEVASGAADCDGNGVPDACQLASGASTDLDGNGVIDDCEPIVGGSGYPEIQDAINVLPAGSTILVGAGEWAPFTLTGHALTIRSLGGAATTAIDANGSGRCVAISDTGPDAVLIEGFTLRGGAAAQGAGIRIENASVVLRDCAIVDNTASGEGGGAFVRGAIVLVDGCVLERNAASAGGGVFIATEPASAVTVQDARLCINAPDNIDGSFVDGGGNLLSTDCDGDGACDADELAAGAEQDCNGNGLPDTCDIAGGDAADCNVNGIPDSCDIASGASSDIDGNGVPDDCKPDCDGDGIPDAYEIAQGLATDCDDDGLPDACEIAADPALDCDADGSLDTCEISGGTEADCDGDGLLDRCEIDDGSEDKNGNGVPDHCEFAAGDLDLSGDINAADLAVLLSFWGFPSPPVGDLDGNGVVSGGDLSILLGNWGVLDW